MNLHRLPPSPSAPSSAALGTDQAVCASVNHAVGGSGSTLHSAMAVDGPTDGELHARCLLGEKLPGKALGFWWLKTPLKSIAWDD